MITQQRRHGKYTEAFVRQYLIERGSELISPYKNTREPITFKCTKCGKSYAIAFSKLLNGQNKKLLCNSCMGRKQQHQWTIEEIRKLFAEKGAELLSTEYKGVQQHLDFKCSKCGTPYHVSLANFLKGNNKNLVCPKCSQSAKFQVRTIEEIRKLFAEKGAELLSTEYKNGDEPLYFKCSRCGKTHRISFNSFKQGINPNLLCSDCLLTVK